MNDYLIHGRTLQLQEPKTIPYVYLIPQSIKLNQFEFGVEVHLEKGRKEDKITKTQKKIRKYGKREHFFCVQIFAFEGSITLKCASTLCSFQNGNHVTAMN